MGSAGRPTPLVGAFPLLLRVLAVLWIAGGASIASAVDADFENVTGCTIPFSRVRHEFYKDCDSLGVRNTFSVSYVIFESSERESVADSLNRFVARVIYDDSNASILSPDSASFQPFARNSVSDCSAAPYWGCHLNRWIGVVYDSVCLIGLHYGYDSFCGGAHPDTYGHSKTFNSTTGALVTLNTILKDGAQGEFNRRAEPFFRMRYKLPMDGPMKPRGFYFGDSFYVNSNWSVADTGLQFNLNPYEDCSYIDQGSYIVPFSSFKDLIREDGPLGYVLK